VPNPPSLPIKELIWIGKIVKPHGIQGDLKVYLDTETDPQYYLSQKCLYLAPPLATFAELYEVQYKGLLSSSFHLMALKGVRDRNQAESYRGFSLYVNREMLPPLEEETEFYLFEIIGSKVIDCDLGEIGNVIETYAIPGNPLAKVLHQDGYSYFLPLHREITLVFKRKANALYVKLPAGFLEVYKPSS